MIYSKNILLASVVVSSTVLVTGFSLSANAAGGVSIGSSSGPEGTGASGASHVGTAHVGGVGTVSVGSANNRLSVGIGTGPSLGQNIGVNAGSNGQGGLVGKAGVNPTSSSTRQNLKVNVQP